MKNFNIIIFLIISCLYVDVHSQKIKLPMPESIPGDTVFEGTLPVRIMPPEQFRNDSFIVYYTRDESDPRFSETRDIYSGISIVGGTLVYKAILSCWIDTSKYSDSDVLTVTYTRKMKRPTFIPTDSLFNDSISVSLEAETDAEIYYTLNGEEPDTNGIIYNGPIKIFITKTIKAIAIRESCLNSDLVIKTYVKEGLPINPSYKIERNALDINNYCYNVLGQTVHTSLNPISTNVLIRNGNKEVKFTMTRRLYED